MDAIATPFVQGRLRNEDLSFTIRTSCARTGEPIAFEMDSELNYTILEGSERPLIFMPFVDFDHLEAPSIIDDF